MIVLDFHKFKSQLEKQTTVEKVDSVFKKMAAKQRVSFRMMEGLLVNKAACQIAFTMYKHYGWSIEEVEEAVSLLKGNCEVVLEELKFGLDDLKQDLRDKQKKE